MSGAGFVGVSLLAGGRGAAATAAAAALLYLILRGKIGAVRGTETSRAR